VLIIVNIISFSSYFSFQSFTKLKNTEAYSYGFRDIMSRVFIYDAMVKTGEINLGTQEEMIGAGKEKSNYILCEDYFNRWLTEYAKNNPVSSEAKIAFDFTKEYFGKSLLLRVTSPLLFFSLTSNTAETISYLFLYAILIYLSISSIKKIYKTNRNEISVIISVLLGYASVFFLTLSYARYSIPFMFFFLMFAGIFFEKVININNPKEYPHEQCI